MNVQAHEEKLQLIISPGGDAETLVVARLHVAECDWCLGEARSYGQLVRAYRQALAEREGQESPDAAHLSDFQIAAYAGGSARKGDAMRWEAHLADCPICLRLLLEVWEHLEDVHGGSRALVQCPRCGFRTLPADRFCPECGAPLAGAQARRRERLTESLRRWRGRRNLRLSLLGSLALLAEAACLALSGGVVWLWLAAPLPWWALFALLPLGAGVYLFRQLSVRWFSRRDA